MADDYLELADFVADAFDLAQIEVEDTLKAVPLLATVEMEPSSNGTTHKYAKQTGLPTVGFRAVNAGRDMDSSTDSVTTETLTYLDFSWGVDVAAADAWRKGKEDLIAREGMNHISAALVKFEKQVVNGTLGIGDSAGFTGFRNSASINALADAMVINAAGTTADTASSVYGVRIARNGITAIYNGESSVSLGETVVTQKVVNPGTDNKTHAIYYTPGGIWLALQLGSIYDLGRICNLTADSGKGLTDSLLADLLSVYPIGKGPTHWVASRRSLKQLQKSRTATNVTGAPAPFPTESHNIPFIISDAVSDTEALIA